MTCCWVIGLERFARPRSPDGGKLHDLLLGYWLGEGCRAVVPKPWPTRPPRAAATSVQGRPKNRSPESKTAD
jgi:hypothetical protein